MRKGKIDFSFMQKSHCEQQCEKRIANISINVYHLGQYEDS